MAVLGFWHNPIILRYNDNMSKRQVIMFLGVIVIFLPFLGFPTNWDTIISVLVGILIIGIAYKMSPVTKYNAKMSGGNYANVTDSDFQDVQKINGANSMEASSQDLPFVEHQSGAINTK